MQTSEDRSRLERSEQIAVAVASAGLPSVVALNVEGNALQDVASVTVLVYHWIEGQIHSSTPATPHQAGLIGRILGRIHALDLQFPEREPLQLMTFSSDEWATLAENAEERSAAWASILRGALPDLVRWSEILAEAQRALPKRLIVSHADLHQQNVLWSDENTPWLIDWESAGWQQPAKEAVVSALEWSGFVEGDPDIVTFRAFLDAYRREIPLSTDEIKHGLNACFGNWLGWLHYNVRRALGRITDDPEELMLGAEQTVGTLATMRRVETHFPALLQACWK